MATWVAAVTDAEVVAFGVCHHDPVVAVFVTAGLGCALGADAVEALGFGFDVGGVDVDAHPVLAVLAPVTC